MVNFEKTDNIEFVTFSTGKINALIADEIKEKIIRLFDNASAKVVIDLKGVEYIDSSGFGCFLSLLRAARDNYGIIKFTNPEPQIKALFETLNLQTVFEIFNDTESCIRSFR
jgi:anti-sigma B factor antagonist